MCLEFCKELLTVYLLAVSLVHGEFGLILGQKVTGKVFQKRKHEIVSDSARIWCSSYIQNPDEGVKWSNKLDNVTVTLAGINLNFLVTIRAVITRRLAPI